MKFKLTLWLILICGMAEALYTNTFIKHDYFLLKCYVSIFLLNYIWVIKRKQLENFLESIGNLIKKYADYRERKYYERIKKND